MKKYNKFSEFFSGSINARKVFLLFVDAAVIVFSFIAVALMLPQRTLPIILSEFYLLMTAICVLITTRSLLKIYKSIWRFADARDYLYLIMSDVIGCFFCVLIFRHLFAMRIGISYIFPSCTLSLLLTLCSRFVYRQYQQANRSGLRRGKVIRHKRLAIIGAGYAGTTLADEIQAHKDSAYRTICFFDSDRSKIGSTIHGIRVRAIADMEQVIHDFDISEVVIAIPNLPQDKKKAMINACVEAGCRIKVYEYPFTRADKGASADTPRHKKLSLRDINIEDLLLRDSVSLDMTKVRKLIKGSVVLVTGAGGSIGSELCRQIAVMVPEKLVLLDVYENSVFEVQQELLRTYGIALNISVEIATICDADKINTIFAHYRPSIVFHAAAHKHVPLMEDCCDEAVKNNVFGTFNVVQAAEKYGVGKFILISTDKAVNPTNVMGATKRICEMFVQSKRNSKTDFVAVRFGNVLGSNGSVIPMFARQIADGGPVTLTDRRITRYFMTIPEAVQLVMQAGAVAAKSEVFVLDMGEPVKILDLAENMIRLAGLIPHKDIEIVEVGLRPGEKLYEELLMQTDNLTNTGIDKVFIDRECLVSEDDVCAKLAILRRAVETGENAEIKIALKSVVPTYCDPGQVNSAIKPQMGGIVEITYLDSVRAAT